MSLQDLTRQLLAGLPLSQAEAAAALDFMLDGASPVAIASFLTAHKAFDLTADVLAGMALALRARAVPFPAGAEPSLDTCGTGGDGAGMFNVSTMVALVAAAAGARVAKHGNRSASGTTGSADVLEALGARLDLEPGSAARCLETVGFTFLFAPRYHPALAAVAPVRKELGFPTVFNLLGPLVNPARPRYQVLGVYASHLLAPMAGALARTGVERALVVHGHGGLDELALSGPTAACWVEGGEIRPLTLDLQELGLRRATAEQLRGGDAAANAALLRELAADRVRDVRRDMVVGNAGAALWVAGLAPDLAGGVALAAATLAQGAVAATLAAYLAASRA